MNRDTKYGIEAVFPIVSAVLKKYDLEKLSEKEYENLLDKARKRMFKSDDDKWDKNHFEYSVLDCIGIVKRKTNIVIVLLNLATSGANIKNWVEEIEKNGISYLKGYER